MPRLLPNWIDAFKIFTDGLEAPDEYFTWVGLCTLAGVARRGIHFNMGYFRIYPNLYTVLVSPPGVGTKSTAMAEGRKLLGQVPDIKTAAESISRKQFIVDLKNSKVGEQSAITVFSSEFATLIGTSKIEMVVLLTDLFDCPTPKWEHRTESGGIHVIDNPYLNLMAGTTPDQFAKTMPLDIIGTGLASRTIFVWADTPRVRPWRPTLSDAQTELRGYLVEDLTHIATLSGEMTMSPEAEEIYNRWYITVRPNESRTADPRTASYFTRKRIHVIKVMMLLSLAQRDDLVITADDTTKAFELLRLTELGMPYVYGGVGKNPFASDINELLVEMLKRPEGATINELMDKFKYSVRLPELKELLETLLMTGHVQYADSKYYIKLPH